MWNWTHFRHPDVFPASMQWFFQAGRYATALRVNDEQL